MKKTLLIVNPVSGTMKIKNVLLDIISLLDKSDRSVTVAVTRRRGHASEIVRARAESMDELICCGGDGTLNEVIRGLMQSGLTIPCGYIPSGSTNDFARCMGIPTMPLEAAKAIAEGDCLAIDVGRFNKTQYFSYIASFGAFTAASYSTHQSTKNLLGHFAYVLEGIKDVKNISPVDVKVTVGEQEYRGHYVFGAVINSSSIAGIVKLKSDMVDMRDGFFECILVRMPKNITELNQIVTAISRSDFSGEMFEFFRVSDVLFEFEENSDWSLDGEHFRGGKNVWIQNKQQAFTLIQ